MTSEKWKNEGAAQQGTRRRRRAYTLALISASHQIKGSALQQALIQANLLLLQNHSSINKRFFRACAVPIVVTHLTHWSNTMQVHFESRDPEGSHLRDVAIQRLRFVMRRLTWLVPHATVRLADINGPRGGVDKQVLVELQTAGAGTVVITSVGRDWRSTLDAALARAAKALLRTWQRGQDRSRSRVRLQAGEALS